MGVITPYRDQVRAIQRLLSAPARKAGFARAMGIPESGTGAGGRRADTQPGVGVGVGECALCALLEYAAASTAHVEVSTVDQFQGRDKDLIVISLVRSRPAEAEAAAAGEEEKERRTAAAGGILDDIRRLGVALTRARAKLVLLGDAQHLRSRFHNTLKTLLEILPADKLLLLNPSI